MTDTLQLEIAITISGLTKIEVAKALGISTMGLYKKINNLSEFKASEILILVATLNLSIEQREMIFFSQKVDFKSTKCS